MRRAGKTLLVGVALLLMTVDPVAACRFRLFRRCCRVQNYSYAAACKPVAGCDGNDAPAALDDSSRSQSDHSSTMKPVLPPQTFKPEPVPAPVKPVPVPVKPMPAVPVTPPAPLPVPEKPITPPVPAPVPEKPVTPPAPPVPAPQPPMPETPAVPEPEEDLIPAEEPLAPPAEAEMPAEEKPAEEKPALEEDLFNEPSTEAPVDAMPADEPAEEKPADEKAPSDDDLFGEPAADAAAGEMPADEPAAEAPADEAKPSSDVDDLFNDSTDAADQAEPAKTAANDPLPADPAAAPAESDVDNLFEEAADDKPAALIEEPTDDLMEEADPADAMPVGDESTQMDPSPASEVSEPVTVGSRVWTDNTGKFQVSARLVVVLDGAVRLQKDSGRYTTVSLDRLSNADRQFVVGQSQLSAKTNKAAGQQF